MHLDGSEELPAGNPYGFSTASDHTYTLNTFYTATVTGTVPDGALPPADPNLDYSQTGWGHSIHNPNRVDVPAPNFYGSGQDHERSDSILVHPDGTPNLDGLAQANLTAEQVTQGRWAPRFHPGDIANGDFEAGWRSDVGLDMVSGWSQHGGGGDSEILSETSADGENFYMALDDDDPSGDDRLEASIGDTFLGEIDLNSTSDWLEQTLDIPIALRDQVETITLQLSFGSDTAVSPVVSIDNVHFELWQLPGDYNQDFFADELDYVVWRNAVGQTGMNLSADGSRNGVVDQADFEIWRSHYGAAATTNPANAPEPTAWRLVLLAIGFARLRQRRIGDPRCPTSPCTNP